MQKEKASMAQGWVQYTWMMSSAVDQSLTFWSALSSHCLQCTTVTTLRMLLQCVQVSRVSESTSVGLCMRLFTAIDVEYH